MPVKAGGMPDFDSVQVDMIMQRFNVESGPYGLIHRVPGSCAYTGIFVGGGNSLTFDRPGGAAVFQLIWELLDVCGAVVFDPGTMASAVSRSDVRDAMPPEYPVIPYVAATWQELMSSTWEVGDPV